MKLRNFFTLLLSTLIFISCEGGGSRRSDSNTESTTSGEPIPDKFDIDEYVVSIGTDFKMSNGAYIEQEIISLTSNFTLTYNDEQYGRAKQRFISIGSKIDIYDENDELLGTVEEQIFSSWGIYSKYYIYDKNGKKIAKSEKHQLMATSFEITDMSGDVICEIERPMINLFSDSWSVDFKSDKYDKRLFVFIPCYKTHRDNQDED